MLDTKMAAGPVQLVASNFHTGRDGQTLSITITQPTFLLVTMDACPGCDSTKPIFARLCAEESRAMFATVNVTHHRSVVQLSKSTNLPISATPTLVFFVNGVAAFKFKGNLNYQSIRSFVTARITDLQKQHDASRSTFVGAPQAPSYQQGPASYQPSHTYAPTPQPGGYPSGPPAPQPYKYKGADDEETPQMLIPHQITPYNVPWQSEESKMGEF